MFDESKKQIALKGVLTYAQTEYLLYRVNMERSSNATNFAVKMDTVLMAQQHLHKHRAAMNILKDMETMWDLKYEEEG